MAETRPRIDVRAVEDAHASGAVPRRPVVIVRAQGATLWDDEDREYIDASSAQGWANVGHSHPHVVRAIEAQCRELVAHTESSYTPVRARWYEALVELLEEAFPANSDGRIARIQAANSGAEAIEAAIKWARMSTGRTKIVTARRGFHGRTMGALSATANPKYQKPFAPLVPGFEAITYNKTEALDAALSDDVAALILEAVQGEGGVHPGSEEFLRAARDLCRARGIRFIVDEIQTGFGRTGSWFASEAFGLDPDGITMGKAIGGGLPLGAFAWRDGLPTFAPGTHGSTFAANPLSCAASIAAIEVMRSEELPARAQRFGEPLIEAFRSAGLPVVREVRGRGMMVGIELKSKVGPVLQRLTARGVWALPAGMSVLRLLPPLVTSEKDLSELTRICMEELKDAG